MCQQCAKTLKTKLYHLGYALELTNKLIANVDSVGKCPAMKALEDLTPSGSEFYEDPTFCFRYVRQRLHTQFDLLKKKMIETRQLQKDNIDLQNKAIEQQKRINALDNVIIIKDEQIKSLEVECFHAHKDDNLELVGRTCRHCGKQFNGTAFGICPQCGRFQ